MLQLCNLSQLFCSFVSIVTNLNIMTEVSIITPVLTSQRCMAVESTTYRQFEAASVNAGYIPLISSSKAKFEEKKLLKSILYMKYD